MALQWDSCYYRPCERGKRLRGAVVLLVLLSLNSRVNVIPVARGSSLCRWGRLGRPLKSGTCWGCGEGQVDVLGSVRVLSHLDVTVCMLSSWDVSSLGSWVGLVSMLLSVSDWTVLAQHLTVTRRPMPRPNDLSRTCLLWVRAERSSVAISWPWVRKHVR